MPRDAVFLDRDGTLIEEVHHLAHPDQVRLIPGAADAVRRLNDAGVLVVVVTNQAGVARGYFPESRVPEVHARVSELLAECGRGSTPSTTARTTQRKAWARTA